MKERNKKIIAGILGTITIINMIYLIRGFILYEMGNHSFNASLSSSTYNLTNFAVILGVLQLISIGILIRFLKKGLSRKKQIVMIVLVVVILIITPFVPVKNVSSIKYTFPDRKKDKDLLNAGSTTHIRITQNLYGFKLKVDQDTSWGIKTY